MWRGAVLVCLCLQVSAGDAERAVTRLKSALMVSTGATKTALNIETRSKPLHDRPRLVRQVCVFAADCVSTYTYPAVRKDPFPIVDALEKFVGGVKASTDDTHELRWAKCELRALRARLNEYSGKPGATALLEAALAIRECTKNTAVRSLGYLRCVELHLEARHMLGADRVAILAALERLRDETNAQTANHAAVAAAVSLERALDLLAEPKDPEKRAAAGEEISKGIAVLNGFYIKEKGMNLDVVRRHNDLVTLTRRFPKLKLKPEYQFVRYGQRGLPFSVPLSRHWRVFSYHLQFLGDNIVVRRVTTAGAVVSRDWVAYGMTTDKDLSAKKRATKRFRSASKESGYKSNRRTRKPKRDKAMSALKDVYTFQFWGTSREKGFERQRGWVFTWRNMPAALYVIEVRDLGAAVPPELAACLASFGKR